MSHEQRPVSLEDLLRLKRAERPPAEFWSEFDRQLRAKQLAALVQKRPWWDAFRSFGRLARINVAAGALATLAITFVTLREQPSGSERVPTVGSDVGPAAVASATAERHAAVDTTAGAADSASPRAGGAPAALVAMAEPVIAADGPVLATHDAAAPEAFSAFSALTAAPVDAAPPSPSARFIAANYAAAQDGVGTPLLADAQGFELRGAHARVAKVDPLQQMTPPGEARRSNRFLAAMVSTASVDSDLSARTTERVASRISPDELYDQVRRIGTRQGGFNVRF